MNYKRKFLSRFALGIPLGMILCLLITVLTTTQGADDGKIHFCTSGFVKAVGSESLALIIQEIVTGLYGGIVMGTTVFYDVEHWSILRSTASHFVVTFVSYFITAVSLRWFSTSDIAEILIMFVIMVIGYAIIWLANYLAYRSEIKKINSGLLKLKEHEKDQK